MWADFFFFNQTNSKHHHTACEIYWESKTQPCSKAGYTAMAVHSAGSHPVNISEQKNITTERTLNCSPRLSLRDSILLFWRQGFRWHTASFSTFSTAVTSLPKFRGKKKLKCLFLSATYQGLELIQERVMFGILSRFAENCAKWTELLR